MTAPEEPGDLAPVERLAALRREEAEGARLRRWVLFWLAAFWAIVIQMVFPPAPRLVWNATASAPVGFYWVSPGAAVRTGSTVIAWTPAPSRRLAATRHYIPENVPLVKRVAGMSGDRVCAVGGTILVNGRRVATRLIRDGQGRLMPWWSGCHTLAGGEVFLLMADVPSSFDGRYFGITKRSDVVGRAQLLWRK